MHRRARLAPTLPILFLLVSAASCAKANPYETRLAALKAAFAAAALPPELASASMEKIRAAPQPFFQLLDAVSAQRRADPMLFARADKESVLAAGYEPSDLVSLDGKGLSVSRKGHQLRPAALEALKAMDAAARASDVTLLVSSTYRSYAYQKEVFARDAAQVGEVQAELEVARPGRSQHQLGLALDFGPISDAFAATAAGRWTASNAGGFGFSRSYPEGMQAVTGYRPESWHFRFIGKDAVALQDGWFGGFQHHLLKFLQAWPEESAATR